MKKNILLTIIICLLSFIGCHNNKNEICSSNDEKYISANNLIKKVFNQEEYIYSFLPKNYLLTRSNTPNINDIEYLIGLECLRNNNGFTYSVHKFINKEKQTGYCFISYNNKLINDCWFVSKIPDKKQFTKLKLNINSFEDIKKFDSSAFLYDFDNPCSIHRFKDGSIITIYYEKTNNEYIVKNFDWTDDPAHIVENLLPVDLKLVY